MVKARTPEKFSGVLFYIFASMETKLQIIPVGLLEQYKLDTAICQLSEKFDALKDAEISTNSFSFYTSVSSVFSSKIEGEEIDLDSFVKHKRFGIEFLPDYTKKIDDLYNAYTFAKTNVMCKSNIEEAHKLLCRHIVAKHQQGKIRKQNMYVTNDEGNIEYVAATLYEVEAEMQKFYIDVDLLMRMKMGISEVFYYAAMVHLVFVKIHPWNDGNGRSARLLEKWFLAQKLGDKSWFIQSEKYYYLKLQTYYNNIRILGLEYPSLDYSQALPFLLMLPNSI
ncbi:MAG: Fic family protein [Prolixibacteraceae bacterium]|jgi:Fic family protein|nr:Fic family protein [Prolixibacteraceae bacterium]